MDWADGFKAPEKPKLTRDEMIMAKWTAEAMTNRYKVMHRASYRMSAMPICGHYEEVIDRATKMESVSKDFYTGIGTVIHELLQDQYPLTRNGARVWGNWKCRNPKCKHLMKEQTYPFKCQKCNSKNPKYVEVEVTYKGVVTGHVDLLLLLKNGRFWLNDWKTCGAFALDKPDIAGLPYPKNCAQVEGYGVALFADKGIVVEKIFLNYVLRGDPDRDAENPINRPYEIPMTKALFQARRKQLDRIVAEKTAFEAWKANPTKSNLAAFDRLRPCHCASDYADKRFGMSPHFAYEGPCAFANEAGCFTKGWSEPAKILERRLKAQGY